MTSIPALVLEVERQGGQGRTARAARPIEISGDGLKFARPMIGDKAPNNRAYDAAR